MTGIDWSGAGEASSRRIGMSEGTGEVSLSKQGGSTGTLRVNLRWSQVAPPGERPGRRSLFGGGKEEAAKPVTGKWVDLDLGCLYQFTDGQRGVVQAVGKRSGDFARAPFIKLDRDDRIGSQAGENLFINMDHSAHFRRILIFVMIASGADDLTAARPVVTVYPAGGPALEIKLSGPTGFGGARSCAVALLRRQGTDMVLKREVQYFRGYQSDIDGHYGWGLRWGPGHGKDWGTDTRKG